MYAIEAFSSGDNVCNSDHLGWHFVSGVHSSGHTINNMHNNRLMALSDWYKSDTPIVDYSGLLSKL